MAGRSGGRRADIGSALAGAVLAALVALAPVSAGAAGAPPRPNILLILIDTLRADHLGAYGYSRPTSPFLDQLAARGTVFTRAYSTTSWTQPAIASLFTGSPPAIMAPRSRRYIVPRAATLASALQAGGYRTAGFVANPFVHRGAGFAQGFEEYASWRLTQRAGEPDDAKAPAAWVNEHASRWLASPGRGDAPWLLYLHYMEPHLPYAPAEPVARRFWRDRALDVAATVAELTRKLRAYHDNGKTEFPPREVAAMIDLYDGAIAEVDAAIADLFRHLDAEVRARTIVCVTADHGEEFADHGRFLHAHSLYEELIRVPLILVSPGGGMGTGRIDHVVEISDVAPTLLDLAGVAPPPGFSGRSLRGPTGGGGGAAVAALAPFAQTVHRQALVGEQYKLVLPMEGDEPLLFDLRDDPGERRNRAMADGARTAVLRDELARRTSAPAVQVAEPPPTVMPDAPLRERLRALGYDF